MERDILVCMEQTEMWLQDLRAMGRKENSIRTLRTSVKRCLMILDGCGRPTDAHSISESDILYLWNHLPLKENVKWSYLRSLANMVRYHTGRDIVRETRILHNRTDVDRVFITGDDLRRAYIAADTRQRLILCLGAYMGLRRAEMVTIRDTDIRGNVLTVHGKGHGEEGYIVNMTIPEPVMKAIEEYKRSVIGTGIRLDDYLIQTRDWDGNLHRMSPSRVSDSISSLGKSIGIRMTPHSLRRLYATTLYYEVGCDLQTMKNLMRHADVSTTLKCYVNADVRREREASEKLVGVLDGLVRGA